MTCTDTSTPVVGPITNCHWDFGDGGLGDTDTAAGGTASHTYATPGSYTITLTLTATGGSATTSHAITVSAPTLVAHWAFDDGTSPTAEPVSGYVGTLQTGPAWSGAGVLGADSLAFDGAATSYVAIGNQPKLNLTDSLTFSAWVKNPGGNAGAWGAEIISKNTSYNFGFGGGSANKLWFGFHANGGWRDFLGNTTTWTPDTWYHVAVTEDASNNIRLFVNGIEDGSFTTAYTRPADAADVVIGRHSDLAIPQYYSGGLDDLGVWNYDLDPKKIALLNGLGRFAGVNLGDPAIDNVLAVFNAASGSAAVGSQTWVYKTGLGSTTVGATGGSVAGGDAYIVLDDSGNGVGVQPGASTPYQTWAGVGGPAFTDLNSEGIAYGMAWMLGAATKTSPSVGLLPTPVPGGSGLPLHFSRVHDQGSATLRVQYSTDLGTWNTPGVLIPASTYGTNLDLGDGITATITSGTPNDDVTVTISNSHAVGGKLFGHLVASE